MTATTALFAVLSAWLVIGAICSFVMARRGHDAWSWAALGALFGPLVVPLALAATKRDRETAPVVAVVHEGRQGAGSVVALVGVDGSPDAEAAACNTVRLLGPRLGRVILATVLDYDAAREGDAGKVYVEEAARMLDDAASIFCGLDPDQVVLTGRPADALVEYAREQAVDVLAVGARGRGLSTALLGSVAARAVRQHDVPVLVAGRPKVADEPR